MVVPGNGVERSAGEFEPVAVQLLERDASQNRLQPFLVGDGMDVGGIRGLAPFVEMDGPVDGSEEFGVAKENRPAGRRYDAAVIGRRLPRICEGQLDVRGLAFGQSREDHRARFHLALVGRYRRDALFLDDLPSSWRANNLEFIERLILAGTKSPLGQVLVWESAARPEDRSLEVVRAPLVDEDVSPTAKGVRLQEWYLGPGQRLRHKRSCGTLFVQPSPVLVLPVGSGVGSEIRAPAGHEAKQVCKGKGHRSLV